MNKLFLYLRSFVFYFGYVPLTLVMTTLFILLFPLMPERGRHRFISAWVDAVMCWLRVCCDIRYQVSGLENLPAAKAGTDAAAGAGAAASTDAAAGTGTTGPVVVLANHQSTWETFLFYRLIFPVAPILKKELLYIPFFGWGLWLQGVIAIDRSSPVEAGKSLLRNGTARIRQGYSVLVFPEGTRSPPGEVRKFSRGGAKLAAAAGVPIVPVAHNAGNHWPRGLLKHPGLITVTIAPPIPTTTQDPSALTTEAETWIHRTAAAMPDRRG